MASNETRGVRPPDYENSRGSIDFESLDLGDPVRQRGDTTIYEATESFPAFTATPTVVDRTVYAPCENGTLYALDVETGETV